MLFFRQLGRVRAFWETNSWETLARGWAETDVPPAETAAEADTKAMLDEIHTKNERPDAAENGETSKNEPG